MFCSTLEWCWWWRTIILGCLHCHPFIAPAVCSCSPPHLTSHISHLTSHISHLARDISHTSHQHSSAVQQNARMNSGADSVDTWHSRAYCLVFNIDRTDQTLLLQFIFSLSSPATAPCYTATAPCYTHFSLPAHSFSCRSLWSEREHWTLRRHVTSHHLLGKIATRH